VVLSGNGSDPAKIRVTGATKVYKTKTRDVHALEDFTLEVAEGEFVCILGPSGCGKTTLLWAMSGLHALTRGEIFLSGKPLKGPRPAEIGVIFQEANLLPWRNLRQNIEFPFEIKKNSVDRARVDVLLEETGLAEFAGSMPRELSGGMQQRASIVRALA
jgi:NitT/TauT family transport system ATP-binding protein